MDSLRRIVRGLRNSSRQSPNHFGLTSAQFFVLAQIESSKSLSMNSLADLTFTHQSTVSETVGRLVQKSLVAKTKDEVDSRSVVLSVTKKGAAALASAPEAAQQNLAHAVRSMPDKKRQLLSRLLIELVHVAKLSNEPATLFFE